MKKHTKRIACFLAFLLLVSMLAGCQQTPGGSPSSAAGESSASGEPVEEQVLEIAVFEGGYGRAYWDAAAKAFEEANPGVTVNITANPEIGEIIRPNILSGNAPDFIYLASNNASGVATALIKDKALADLTDVMEEVKDKILPGFLETSNCQPYGDGKIYLAPMYYSSMGLWYNKTFFEENNLEPATTWEEFFALGDKAKELGRALFTYQGLVPAYLESLVTPAIATSAGLEGMEKCAAYEEGAWKNEGIRQVLENIARIGSDGYLMDGTVALDHTQSQSEWLAGKALFIPCGSWIEGEMADAPREKGFEYGFCAPPVLNAEADKYVFSSIEEMYIPAAAKNVELAKKFLIFQYSDEMIQLNAELAKGVPPVVGAADYLKEYVSDAVYESYMVYEEGYSRSTASRSA